MNVATLSNGLIRLVVCFARSLPPSSIGGIAWIAGTVWWSVDARRRKRIAENLRVAFGDELTANERKQLARQVFRNMARVPVEVLWFDRLLASPAQVERRCVFEGSWPAPEEGPGVIAAGHLGNWEVCIRGLRHRLKRFRTVVRPVDVPAIDELVTRIRGGRDSILEKHGASRGLMRSLAEGWWVGIASDQNAGLDGLYLPFFGLVASQHDTPARLALREGVPLYFVSSRRLPGPEIHFTVRLDLLAHPARRSADPEAVSGLTQAVSDHLEQLVRATPEQYNFLHRRWKDRPAGEAPGPHLPRYDHHRPR